MNNLFKQDTKVTLEQRRVLKGHNSFVVWFTGLSGSGKSTIASEVYQSLIQEGIHSYLLDGDNIRLGINSDLDFSDEGRKENIRRIAEVAKLFVDAGEVVLTSFISPFIEDRASAREIIGHNNFIEVFINCPLEECEKRDVKGLYAKARSGEIKSFTGIDSPYEEPTNPDIVVFSAENSIKECAEEIIKHIKNKLK
jgi:adenylylsulfate kinase